MARFLGSFLLLGVLIFGIWPYYTVFSLDTALGGSDAKAIAPFVDLPAIQEHYKERLGNAVGGFLPSGNSESDRAIGWLAENLSKLGDTALDQTITLDWVRNSLRDANSEAGGSFISGINFAFFESWNQFVIRLGKLGEHPTHVVMTLEGTDWKITDVVR